MIPNVLGMAEAWLGAAEWEQVRMSCTGSERSGGCQGVAEPIGQETTRQVHEREQNRVDIRLW